MSTPSVPERIRWVVEQLDFRPSDRVLEIGAAPGAAAQLICDRLDSGQLLAIDRSLRGADLVTRRNEGHVATGRLEARATALADLDGVEPHSIDLAFAVNVNVFWTTPATAECDVLAHVLRPSGRLLLAYSSPGPDHGRHLGRVESTLERGGFRPLRRLTGERAAGALFAPPSDGRRSPR